MRCGHATAEKSNATETKSTAGRTGRASERELTFQGQKETMVIGQKLSVAVRYDSMVRREERLKEKQTARRETRVLGERKGAHSRGLAEGESRNKVNRVATQ
jgi:hypothetical protein